MAERTPVEQRIYANVQIDMFSGCHVWMGATDRDGYGLIKVHESGKWVTRRVHRVTWEKANGPIPPMHVLDHLLADRPIAPGQCRYRTCCNEAHLECVSISVNSSRVEPWNSKKTHCAQGHEYSIENTRIEYLRSGGIRRHCRACTKAREVARRQHADC